MKINSDSRILILSDIVEGAYKYQYAFDCVPRTITEMGYPLQMMVSETTTFETFRKAISDFKADLVFCYLQKSVQVIKIAGFLKEYHPVPVINWYLEDPNGVVSLKSNINILDATASFDFWFSQDSRMQRFWKTKSAFMPPGFNEMAYSDLGLEEIWDVSYIGQLGSPYVTQMYWPYMKELAHYDRKAMPCVECPMRIPLSPPPHGITLNKGQRINKFVLQISKTNYVKNSKKVVICVF